MIKKLLTPLALIVTISLNAQTGKIARSGVSEPNPAIKESLTQSKTVPTCYTISVLTGTDVSADAASSDTTTPGCNPLAGYVFGSNCYQDKEKANFFSFGFYTAANQPSVSAVRVTFYKNGTMGTGGTSSVNVNLAIYSGSLNTGPTGTAVVTITANIGQIVAAQTGTNPFFVYTYTLAAPLAIPANGFFASVIVPITAGDTAVVANDPDATSNLAWEKWSDNSWVAMNAGNSWGPNLFGSLSILPVVCGSSVTTGVSANSGLSKKITLMPNPSSGLVNISVSLPVQENLNISVTNALGQIINAASFKAVTYDNLRLDLSDQPNGVYFVSISNGTDKIVQRLIINK